VSSEAPVTRDWQSVIRDSGHRLTVQRELVLTAVDSLGHATPDEVLAKVREQARGVNVSTVYRTLDLLESLGLVRHTHLSDRAPTYHSTATPEHVHLVCRACGAVLEATVDQMEPLRRALEEHHGFTADLGHLTVFGACAGCGPEAP
jgi:Fur family ferric uptake transcriptional regulator